MSTPRSSSVFNAWRRNVSRRVTWYGLFSVSERISIDDLSADDGGSDPSAERPPIEGRVLGFRDQRGRVDGDGEVRREHGDVGGRALVEGSSAHMEQPRGIDREQLDHALQRDAS